MILFIRYADGESIVEAIDSSETHRLQMMLADLGVRLADIFGADSVLWVEGKTEESWCLY